MDKTSVSSSVLEERVAMYLQAIEYATAANDPTRREALERDIQTLMDLMEKVSVGQVVTADAVPPPLHIHSHAGEPLANPLGELSSRLADYHKALYFADIEIGQNRTQKIQTLQRGLQVIQKLQEKAQAGFPIRAEEIPPPVIIPTDDEFVVSPVHVITERIALFYQAIEIAEEKGNKTRVKTLQEGIKKMDYLLKRAESNIPIYKQDLPCPPALGKKFRKMTEGYRTTVELLKKMCALSSRAAKLAKARGDVKKESHLQHNAKMLAQALQDFEMGKPINMSSYPYSLAEIEQLADEAGVPASQHIQDVETIRLRCNQYKLEALKAKRNDQKDLAVQHMKVVKGLQSLLHNVEKGEKIDMFQVPPPPSEQTPTTEEEAWKLTQENLQETSSVEIRTDSPIEYGGMSLAEELSAYLCDSPLPSDRSDSPSGEGTTTSSDSSPEKMKPSKSSNIPSSLVLQNQTQGREMDQTFMRQTSSSGLNPLYALTQNDPCVLESLTPQPSSVNSMKNSTQTPPVCLLSQSVPPAVPSRALKPIFTVNSLPLPPRQSLVKSVNGFHGGSVILEPKRLNQTYLDGEQRAKPAHTELADEVSRLNLLNNETPILSPEMTCIEILKYERMQLEKEGSDDAKVAAEKLSRQMEEEKQRLRDGGYEAWLAYLGQVEEDVTNINCEMKRAREKGEESRLASLIIKKELADRELAVMRKRLPELET